jgi:hypothetical protein
MRPPYLSPRVTHHHPTHTSRRRPPPLHPSPFLPSPLSLCGADWASGGAIPHVFAGSFAPTRYARRPFSPLPVVRNGAPQRPKPCVFEHFFSLDFVSRSHQFDRETAECSDCVLVHLIFVCEPVYLIWLGFANFSSSPPTEVSGRSCDRLVLEFLLLTQSWLGFCFFRKHGRGCRWTQRRRRRLLRSRPICITRRYVRRATAVAVHVEQPGFASYFRLHFACLLLLSG